MTLAVLTTGKTSRYVPYETNLSSVTVAGIVIDKPFLDHEWEESMGLLNVNVGYNFHSPDIDTYSTGHGKHSSLI